MNDWHELALKYFASGLKPKEIANKLNDEGTKTNYEAVKSYLRRHKKDAIVKEKMDKLEEELKKKLDGKEHVCMIDYEDHWPEGEVFEICRKLPSLVDIINYH